jgi:hypothetical protein
MLQAPKFPSTSDLKPGLAGNFGTILQSSSLKAEPGKSEVQVQPGLHSGLMFQEKQKEK